MAQYGWFRCEQAHATSDDGLHRLRRAILRLYRDGSFVQHGLISVVVPAAISGFDRLAARLDYGRLMADFDFTACTTLTDHGPVMALWRFGSGWEPMIDELRDRLAAVCPRDRRPVLRLARLPHGTPEALALLAELGA